MEIKLGTVASRHPLPVDYYLLDEVVPGQAAYDAAYEATTAWILAILAPRLNACRNDTITVALYYTGLTEVTLGVLDAFAAARRNGRLNRGLLVSASLELRRYDAATQEYQPLLRHPSMTGHS